MAVVFFSEPSPYLRQAVTKPCLASSERFQPPDRALVLCVDEKTQVQALDRTAPLLPLRPGQPERRTHDYERHGTTSLFAALNIASGKVIARCAPRHRAIEFRRFLNTIDAAVPPDVDTHWCSIT